MLRSTISFFDFEGGAYSYLVVHCTKGSEFLSTFEVAKRLTNVCINVNRRLMYEAYISTTKENSTFLFSSILHNQKYLPLLTPFPLVLDILDH